jgi:hypothetical protein
LIVLTFAPGEQRIFIDEFFQGFKILLDNANTLNSILLTIKPSNAQTLKLTAMNSSANLEGTIFSDREHEHPTGVKLLKVFRYWHNRRVLFNIIVGSSGLAGVLFFMADRLVLMDAFWMLLWGGFANICYTSGYLVDSFLIVRSGGKSDLGRAREFLFWTGTLAYSMVTLTIGVLYAEVTII